jgi:peptide deformylase
VEKLQFFGIVSVLVMCTIVQEPNNVLRAVAKEVPLLDISSPKIQSILTSMQQVLRLEPDGVAIAAPQIAESFRIFVIAGFVFDLKRKNIGGVKSPNRIFINPVITKKSKETKWIPGEGCLSVRWIYGTAKRHKQATVKAYDEHGRLFTLSASGLLAQIFQHEIDHLNGTLFIDKATKVQDLPPATSD